ncbi:MAG: uroporphyrinogen decarboxylase family protein [Pyrinomonadaceae bacterium]
MITVNLFFLLASGDCRCQKRSSRGSFRHRTAALLELMREAGGDVIGFDWRVRLDEAWRRVGDVAAMGNLDPVVFFSEKSAVIAHTKEILCRRRNAPGTSLIWVTEFCPKPGR